MEIMGKIGIYKWSPFALERKEKKMKNATIYWKCTEKRVPGQKRLKCLYDSRLHIMLKQQLHFK